MKMDGDRQANIHDRHLFSCRYPASKGAIVKPARRNC
jgi:hypothetical protein